MVSLPIPFLALLLTRRLGVGEASGWCTGKAKASGDRQNWGFLLGWPWVLTCPPEPWFFIHEMGTSGTTWSTVHKASAWDGS